MKTKLAGHLPLQDAIAKTIEEAREKMKLAAEESDKDEKVKKLLKFEKKEHGHIPSEKEEKAECKDKTSSVIDPTDPEEIEKLASALDSAAELLSKEADSIDNGGEKHQGGQQLPTQSPTGGTQPYKKDGSKKHQVPTSTGLQHSEVPDSKTQVPNDHARAPGGTGAKYPAKGVLKTGAAALQAEVEKLAKEEPKDETTLHRARRWGKKGALIGGGIGLGVGGLGALGTRHFARAAGMEAPSVKAMLANAAYQTAGGAAEGYGIGRLAHRIRHGKASADEKVKKSGVVDAIKGSGKKEKKSSVEDAVSYILSKISASQKTSGVENGGEARQGGEQLSNTAPVPSNPGRNLISNAQGIKNVTKREAKAPRKKELAEVLTEPAMTSSTDSKVQENLRNAAKGGVKIAAARAFLQKIAKEGCTCDGAGKCRHCTMKAKVSAMRGTTGSEATA